MRDPDEQAAAAQAELQESESHRRLAAVKPTVRIDEWTGWCEVRVGEQREVCAENFDLLHLKGLLESLGYSVTYEGHWELDKLTQADGSLAQQNPMPPLSAWLPGRKVVARFRMGDRVGYFEPGEVGVIVKITDAGLLHVLDPRNTVHQRSRWDFNLQEKA